MPISDVVLLEGTAPNELMNSDEPYQHGKWFMAKNIETIPLSKLGEILGVSTYSDLMKGFEPIVPPEGEAFLLSFPEILQDRIKSLSDDEINTAVEKWVHIDEFGPNAPEEPFRVYLRELRDFLNGSNEYAVLYLAV